MNWKWWVLTVLLEVCWFTSAFSDKKEKEWPPMPPLDSLVGDTSGAITICDSALIPTFGIYPADEWGKVIYIDTTTFKKYGMVLFFDPWDKSSRKFVKVLSELRRELEHELGFQVFLVAARKTTVSCRDILDEYRRPTWNCRTFLMPDFKEPYNSTDSLKKSLGNLETSFPVYRLKQPLRFHCDGNTMEYPFSLTAKEEYVAYMEAGIGAGFTETPVFKKQLLKFAFSLVVRNDLSKWEPAKGGDKK